MTLFMTGISTGVGKTFASAIAVESLQADYWKPVQAGDLHQSDSMEIARLISNDKTTIFPEGYKLNTPASPHLSAQIDGITIDLEKLQRPESENLVIEGAGGLLVPLNDTQTIRDLIRPSDKVIVVSRHYLGSINHTLLTIEALKSTGAQVGVIFNGDENASTEEYVLKTGVFNIGRIDNDVQVNRETVLLYADKFRDNLKSFACL